MSGWQFPEQPSITVVSASSLSIQWSRPQPLQPLDITNKVPVVYLVLWRCDTIPEWQKVDMTSDLHATVDGDHNLYSGIQFRLLVTSTREVLADLTLPFGEYLLLQHCILQFHQISPVQSGLIFFSSFGLIRF